METEPKYNSEDPKPEDEQKHIPFDGFVNVNDIVEKRRRLKMAKFNNPDQIWDADMNALRDENQ